MRTTSLQPRSMVLVCLCCMAVSCFGQVVVQSRYYDTFNERWLDPNKWLATYPNCWGTLECVREIQNGKLRLAVRDFGTTNSDAGVQWSESPMFFVNPNIVTSITADVAPKSFSGLGCATNNTDLTHTQVMIGGSYFNSGSGDPSDDVMAFLIIWIDTNNPTYMNVLNWWGWRDQAQWSDMGTYPIGTVFTGKHAWDRTNHQFVASLTVKNTGQTVTTNQSYTMPDGAPAANPYKYLTTQAHSLNCTSAKTFAQAEATFDNVIINH